MLTARRVKYAQIAIACFRRQTWRQCELVIVYDSFDTATCRMVTSLRDDARIRLVCNERRNPTIGYLRNLSVRAATGAYCVQWDDDDLYHSERVERQMAEMVGSGKLGCVLSSWICYAQSHSLMFESAPYPYEGTILIATDVLRRYPYPNFTRVQKNGREVGEDAFVVQRLDRLGMLHRYHCPWLYVYRIHESNTCSKAHFAGMYTSAMRANRMVYQSNVSFYRRMLRLNQFSTNTPIIRNRISSGLEFIKTHPIGHARLGATGRQIPQVLFLTYFTSEAVPAKVFDRWRHLNPEYDIVFFSDYDCEYCIEHFYGERYLRLYRAVPHPALRCDFFRLCLLYVYGGVYCDIDLVPYVGLTSLLEATVTFASCIACNRCSLFQAFLATSRRNPIVLESISTFVQLYETTAYDGSCVGNWSGVNVMWDALWKHVSGKYDGHTTRLQTRHQQIELLQESTADSLFNCAVYFRDKKVFKSRWSDYPTWRNMYANGTLSAV